MSLRARFSWTLICAATQLVIASWSGAAKARPFKGDVTFGGMHVGYGIGASAAQSNSGLRHGLDVAFLPFFYVLEKSGSHSYETAEGLAIGPSALIGFGNTPNYVALDAGWGASTILGVFVGGGPVYRFASDPMGKGYGFEGRLAADFLLLDAGLRVMTVFGDHSSEILGTLFVGLGRF